MVNALKILKHKNGLLTRNAVKAVIRLQNALACDNMPEHVKPHLLACLALLDQGLSGQGMEDEQVLIEVTGGVACVASKSDYVKVVIRDFDNEFEG